MNEFYYRNSNFVAKIFLGYVVKKNIFENKNLTLKLDEKTFYILYKFTSNFYTILKTTKYLH